ncbi:MAG: hypothetical protein ACKO85_03715, partial [Isosphaeraceae bacterium]
AREILNMLRMDRIFIITSSSENRSYQIYDRLHQASGLERLITKFSHNVTDPAITFCDFLTQTVCMDGNLQHYAFYCIFFLSGM